MLPSATAAAADDDDDGADIKRVAGDTPMDRELGGTDADEIPDGPLEKKADAEAGVSEEVE